MSFDLPKSDDNLCGTEKYLGPIKLDQNNLELKTHFVWE